MRAPARLLVAAWACGAAMSIAAGARTMTAQAPAGPAARDPSATLADPGPGAVRATDSGYVFAFVNQPFSTVIAWMAKAGGLKLVRVSIPTTVDQGTVTFRPGAAARGSAAIARMIGQLAEFSGLTTHFDQGAGMIEVLGPNATPEAIARALEPPRAPPTTAPTHPHAHAEPFPAPVREGNRDMIHYKGFAVDVSAVRSSANRDTVLGIVRMQVDLVDDVVMPVEAKAFLETVPIAVGDPPPGAMGVYSHAGGVVITSEEYDPTRPNLLHELMHAYHDQRLPQGFANIDVLQCYQQALGGGRYPPDSYMLSNPMEYFAMVASVFLYGSSPRDPYVRDSIRIKQPECYRFLGTVFGGR